jgi:hypothetical protein
MTNDAFVLDGYNFKFPMPVEKVHWISLMTAWYSVSEATCRVLVFADDLTMHYFLFEVLGYNGLSQGRSSLFRDIEFFLAKWIKSSQAERFVQNPYTDEFVATKSATHKPNGSSWEDALADDEERSLAEGEAEEEADMEEDSDDYEEDSEDSDSIHARKRIEDSDDDAEDSDYEGNVAPFDKSCPDLEPYTLLTYLCYLNGPVSAEVRASIPIYAKGMLLTVLGFDTIGLNDQKLEEMLVAVCKERNERRRQAAIALVAKCKEEKLGTIPYSYINGDMKAVAYLTQLYDIRISVTENNVSDILQAVFDSSA